MAATPCLARPLSEIIPVELAQALNHAALEKRELLLHELEAM